MPSRSSRRESELPYYVMFDDRGRVRKRRGAWNEPGHAHELTFTCARRLQFLSKNRTREWFVDAIDAARRRWNFALWAWVIMPEHVHVLVWPRESRYEMSMILKGIKQPVSQKAVRYLGEHAPQWLERLRVTWPSGRVEHRFWEQGGGYDRNIIREESAWSSIEYIHNNPVRRGLVAAPEEWEWSSARWYAGVRPVRLEIDEPPLPPTPGQRQRGPR